MPAPSFSLAPGDPDALFAAADWHDGVASALSEHAGTITASAGSALAFWQGEAATAYQGLASAMAFSFQTASNQSGDAAGIYRHVAREVDRCQQEGRVALAQAEHWCEEIITANQRVITAQAAIATAQQEIESAAKVVAMTARTPGANVAPAQAQVSVAQDRLHQAQGQLRAAQHDLEHAQRELACWDRRGQQLYEEATLAVEHVTGLPVSITPPPMPGALTGPISPLTKTPPADMQHHGSSFLHSVLEVIHTGADVVSAVGGACASTLFWMPEVGGGCEVGAGAGSLVAGATGVAQAATHNGSWGSAALGAATAAGGLSAGLKLGKDGDELIEASKGVSGSAGAVLKNKGMTYKGAAGALDGLGGSWDAGSATAAAGGHE